MKRSKFSLSTQKPFTMNLGDLVPINVTEVIPSDTVQQQSKVLTRFSPLAAPVFHSCTARLHHFYCSSKNLGDFYEEKSSNAFDWEDFITGGPSNSDTQTIPTINTTGTKGDLLDYLGLPASDAGRTFDASGIAVNILPICMFNFVFNEYFRDADLVTERAYNDLTIPKIAWAKDAMTTARATPQRGTQVSLPIGDEAPIYGKNMDFDGTDDAANKAQVMDAAGASANLRSLGASGTHVFGASTASGTGQLFADLSQATGVDPIEFRRAMALQSWAEIRQKYGARYVEYMRYLGGRMLRPPDRPEYLGGGVAPVQFSEVLQTAIDSGDGVGDMYGHGISLMRGNTYRRTFDEHGYIMSFYSLRPRAVYQDGIHKLWLKQDKEDFFTKELELIGMQPVQIEEIYADAATPGETFAWQENYYDYRTGHSSVAGDFNDTLDYWHLARQFASEPSLNSDFVSCNPSNRIFQSAASDTIWCLAHNSIVARRPVRRNPEPRII
jgi:hypothetical protein